MYKENRIGPHGLWDPKDVALGPVLTANILGTQQTVAPWCNSATVPPKTNTIHFLATNLAIASVKHMAVGIPVSSEHFAGKPNMYTIVGCASYRSDVELHPSFGIAVSDSSTITSDIDSLENVCTKFKELPIGSFLNGVGQAMTISVKETVLCGGFGTNGAEITNPILAYFRLLNLTGGSATMVGLQVSLSIHKHLGSIDTHDPSRS